jgi:hypothetical protein
VLAVSELKLDAVNPGQAISSTDSHASVVNGFKSTIGLEGHPGRPLNGLPIANHDGSGGTSADGKDDGQ